MTTEFRVTDDGGDRLRAHTREALDSEPGVVPDVSVGLLRLCDAAAGELGFRGATVTLMTETGKEAVAATSRDGDRHVDELQFSLGEGPGLDAFRSGRAVLVPDLSAAFARWPAYAPAAVHARACAAFAFPLQLGAVRFGVLSLYDDDTRRLDGHEMSQCLIFADVATGLLLDSTPAGSGDRADPDLQVSLQFRTEVYQAQGMVMVDLRVSLAEALARLRAYSFAEGRDLNELAADVVAGRLRLKNDVDR
ncbi:MAG: GAF and ANTAR domain-containing protein [Nocardioides sp.]